MILRPSESQVIRAAEKVIVRHSERDSQPIIVWARLDDDPVSFGLRNRAIIGRKNTRVLAVVPYGFAVAASVQAVPLPNKLFRLLHPDTPSRYRVASGGRGSGKSHAIATAIILRMFPRKMRVLCAREIQRSLRESVHHLLVEKIDALGLTQYFDVTDVSITCRTSASEIIFAGLHSNVQQLKSLEDIWLCWVEEAESVSQRSLEVLTPTIRAATSEIWLSCNPDDPEAPLMGFIAGNRPDTVHEHVTFADNPWFPPVLEGERAYHQSVDDDLYRHVWLGMCRVASEAQILRGKYAVEQFNVDPSCDGPYIGLDFGFSQDPTAAIKCYIADRVLLITHEAYKIGCDIDRTPQLLDQIPDARKYKIRADNARPETISFLNRHGYPLVESVEKWTGSVEDGIAFLRSFERIVIHERCPHTIEEARLYSFKVDRLSGDVMADVKPGNDHCMDALRYALCPLIRNMGTVAFGSVARGA
jgi:phage terminase large subunit